MKPEALSPALSKNEGKRKDAATAVLDNQELKLQRMEKTDGQMLSRRAYNAILGCSK